MKPEITIYGPRPLRFNIDSLSVSQEEGMHDMFTAYLARPGDVDMDSIKGQPCEVVWNNRFAAQTLPGYVDTTSELEGDTGITGVVIMGLGASSVMRSGEARSWRRTPLHRIAANIVRPYRMGLVTDRYVSSIDSFMQTSDSDWAALARLAGITGMSLVATGTTVRLVDVRKEIGRSRLRPVTVLEAPDSFVQLETPSPVGFDSFEFTGIDALGVNFAVKGGVDGGVKRHSGQNFASLEDARLAAHRHRDRERHYIRAIAEFKGQVPVSSGSVCVVEGQRWYVAKCKHEVRQGTSASSVSVELHRATEDRPTSADAPTFTTPIVRGGKWVSDRRYEVEL